MKAFLQAALLSIPVFLTDKTLSDSIRHKLVDVNDLLLDILAEINEKEKTESSTIPPSTGKP